MHGDKPIHGIERLRLFKSKKKASLAFSIVSLFSSGETNETSEERLQFSDELRFDGLLFADRC